MKEPILDYTTHNNDIKNTVIKWGLISAAISIIYSVINTQLMMNDINFNKALNVLLSSIISIFILYMGIKEFRDKFNGGSLTFGKGFKIGFLIVTISTVIFAIFTFIYYSYIIDYSIIENLSINESIKYMKDKKMSEEQIKQSLVYTRKFLTINFAIISIVIIGIVIGSIFSLILAAILKKENNQYA